jgi:anti-anti-sigma regulatory factor
MRFRPCAITVAQIPETLNVKQGRIFFKELESRINIDRPCIVLDCGKASQMDRLALHMLLCCLEEALKRDGDVKLANVTPEAMESLKMTRVDRLFEIYATESEAVNSFNRPRSERAGYGRLSRDAEQVAVNAA